ncbi:MAG: DUF3137 domain-containing protein, partial [Chitinivibrionales bacterium]
FLTSFKKDLLGPLIESINKNLKYSFLFNTDINPCEFLLSNLFKYVSQLVCTDILSGTFEGFEINCSRMAATHPFRSRNTTHYDNSIDTGMREKIIFDGLFVVVDKEKKTSETVSNPCNLVILPGNKNYNALDGILKMTVKSDSIDISSESDGISSAATYPNQIGNDAAIKLPDGVREIGLTGFESLNNHDKEFLEKFTAYSKSEYGKTILYRPEFKQKLLEIQKAWQNKIYFSCSETRCYVAFSTERELFVPQIIKPWDEKVVEKMRNDYDFIVSAISSTVELAKLTI